MKIPTLKWRDAELWLQLDDPLLVRRAKVWSCYGATVVLLIYTIIFALFVSNSLISEVVSEPEAVEIVRQYWSRGYADYLYLKNLGYQDFAFRYISYAITGSVIWLLFSILGCVALFAVAVKRGVAVQTPVASKNVIAILCGVGTVCLGLVFLLAPENFFGDGTTGLVRFPKNEFVYTYFVLSAALINIALGTCTLGAAKWAIHVAGNWA